MQSGSQGRLFFGAAKSRVTKVHKVQMERSNLSISLPVFWSGTSTKDIYKATENSHFSIEKTECMTYNISERYFDQGLINRGNDTSKGHFDIPFAGLEIFNKYKEVGPSTLSNETISWDGDRFSAYDPQSPSRKERANSTAATISTGEAVCLNKRADSTYWKIISNNCSSSSTSAVPSHAKTANFEFVSREKKRFSHNTYSRGEERTAMVGVKPLSDKR